MGAIWLLNMPDVLRAAGLTVDTYGGWETRSRSSGGYDALLAVQVHHTASSASPSSDMSYMWGGSPDEPVGAIYLARDGRITVGAAGATNTSGKGGPLTCSRGTIPLDSGNRYVISIEAANNGVGEPWPAPQQESYRRLVKALCDAYGPLTSYPDVHAHFEWTTRKIDPAGQSDYATGGNKWNMDAFRADVATTAGTGTDDDMRTERPPRRIYDTRNAGQKKFAAEEARLIPLGKGDVSAAMVTLGAVAPDANGSLVAWDQGPLPTTAAVNYVAEDDPDADPILNSLIVPVFGGSIWVYASAPTHVTVDLISTWD